MRRRAWPALLLLAAACSKNKVETVPVQPAGDPTPPAEHVVPPTAAAGNYRLATHIESAAQRTQPAGSQTPRPSLTLTSTAAAVPAQGAPSGVQYNATVTIPGYTKAPRGRTGQAAAWWPSPGDSVVVQFSQGTNGEIQLRGSLSGTTIHGEIWYLSTSTGSTFQLGTFAATKSR